MLGRNLHSALVYWIGLGRYWAAGTTTERDRAKSNLRSSDIEGPLHLPLLTLGRPETEAAPTLSEIANLAGSTAIVFDRSREDGVMSQEEGERLAAIFVVFMKVVKNNLWPTPRFESASRHYGLHKLIRYTDRRSVGVPNPQGLWKLRRSGPTHDWKMISLERTEAPHQQRLLILNKEYPSPLKHTKGASRGLLCRLKELRWRREVWCTRHRNRPYGWDSEH